MTEREYLATFRDHFSELKATVIQFFLTVFVGILLCCVFYEPLLKFTLSPLSSLHFPKEYLIKRVEIHNSKDRIQIYTLSPEAGVKQLNNGSFALSPNVILMLPDSSLVMDQKIYHHLLIVTSPLDGMMLIFRMSFWGGILLTAPLWSHILLKFIRPGLNERERSFVFPLLLISYVFIAIGFLFTLFFTLPLTNQFLYSFNETLGANLWTVHNYVDYTLTIILSTCLAFELCAIFLFFIHRGLISSSWLQSKWKHACLVSLILGGLCTPPDVFSQIVMGLLLMCFYGILWGYSRLSAK